TRDAPPRPPTLARAARTVDAPHDPLSPEAMARRSAPPPEEGEERQQEHSTRKPRREAVRPLPPVDRLELAERHAAIERTILGNGLVLGELRLPLAVRQRRKDPGDRLPLDYGEAGLGETRRPAEHQCQEHAGRHGQQPRAP